MDVARPPRKKTVRNVMIGVGVLAVAGIFTWLSTLKQAAPTVDMAVVIQDSVRQGDMIREVTRDTATYNDPPMKFETGTPGIVQTIGLGVALEYMMELGMGNIAAHEEQLRDYARARLNDLNWISVQGTTPDKAPIFSFSMQGAAHALRGQNLGNQFDCQLRRVPSIIDNVARCHRDTHAVELGGLIQDGGHRLLKLAALQTRRRRCHDATLVVLELVNHRRGASQGRPQPCS